MTGLDLLQLSAMVGRQLPFFSVLVPFWLVWAFAGWRGMLEIWPAILVAGVSFAIPQFLVSNFHGPWLVDVVAAIVSMACLALFLRVWQSGQVWTTPALKGREAESAAPAAARRHGATRPRWRERDHDRSAVIVAWMPWMILTVFVFVWGMPQFKAFMDGISVVQVPVRGLHNMVEKVPPVVASRAKEARDLHR